MRSQILAGLLVSLTLGCDPKSDDGSENRPSPDTNTVTDTADTTDTTDTTDDPNADDDGDGLTNAEEDFYGTDPDASDSDGDGYSDGDEVNTHDTNPAYAYSHPYTGNYSVGWCETPPAPTGPSGSGDYGPLYQVGDVASNFTLSDQHGESVDLYSFCGQYIMIAFGAFW
ncbi:MAG: hypothetical protein P8R54_03065 [Myxococcota bacterium]|nr:hypothetical protein [Myxococcota bacterium]